MRKLQAAITLFGMLLLSGCGGESIADSRSAVTVDRAIEVQLAVVSRQEPGDNQNDRDWQIVSAWVLPVRSTGGPGTVVSNTDGTIIRIEWSAVRLTQKGIMFDGFRWAIDNRIDRRDGVSHVLQSSNDKSETASHQQQFFGSDFEWLGSVELDTATKGPTGRTLVIRGRMLPRVPSSRPIQLAELTGP